MLDPWKAQFAGLPDLPVLQEMNPDEIGRLLLPIVAAQIRSMSPHGISPLGFARTASQAKANGHPAYAELVMEGLGFLDRAGLIIDNPEQPSSRFVKLSRAGREAASGAQPYLAAAAGQEARTLLHPRIAEAALGHLERGGKYLDDAAFAAFRELEVVVRELSGLSESTKKIVL